MCGIQVVHIIIIIDFVNYLCVIIIMKHKYNNLDDMFEELDDDMLDKKIYKEYTRYKTVTKILNFDSHPKYKLMIERLLIRMADMQNIKELMKCF